MYADRPVPSLVSNELVVTAIFPLYDKDDNLLAIVDLTKAIYEEEVLGRVKKKESTDDTHQTMVRFLGSIIIALSIEALMLVFKFALTDPGKLLYAVYLLVGIGVLILSLSVYLKVNQKNM